MVEISLSGSGEGPGCASGSAYSTIVRGLTAAQVRQHPDEDQCRESVSQIPAPLTRAACRRIARCPGSRRAVTLAAAQ